MTVLSCPCGDPLGEVRQRAFHLMQRLGDGVSDVLTDIFLQAHADGKLEDVFSVLEGYCQSHPPQAAGDPEASPLDETQTRVTLALIIREVLGLTDSGHTLTFLPRGHRYLSV